MPCRDCIFVSGGGKPRFLVTSCTRETTLGDCRLRRTQSEGSKRRQRLSQFVRYKIFTFYTLPRKIRYKKNRWQLLVRNRAVRQGATQSSWMMRSENWAVPSKMWTDFPATSYRQPRKILRCKSNHPHQSVCNRAWTQSCACSNPSVSYTHSRLFGGNFQSWFCCGRLLRRARLWPRSPQICLRCTLHSRTACYHARLLSRQR